MQKVTNNPLQYSCLENPMDRGAWQATVCGVPRVRHDLVIKPPVKIMKKKKKSNTKTESDSQI